jgi:hypothetical protein
MRSKLLYAIFACFLALTAIYGVSAQDGAGTREITSDDFSSKRPVKKASGPVRPLNKRRKATYKRRARKSSGRRKSGAPKKTAVDAKTAVRSDLGVTIWRLRPPLAADKGVRLPVRVGAKREEWTAERVALDTVFRLGDKVRFAIESSSAGFLYVVNSEMYSDGTFGDPYLIFPSTGGGNRVQPGMLIDIPDQKEDLPYFNINPRDPRYAGELLTVIISPIAIPSLKTDRNGKIVGAEVIDDMEEGSDVEEFDRTDNDDSVFTLAESTAACGAKTRSGVVQQSSANPCGSATRQLTRDEPLPQTILRIKANPGNPGVAVVRLNVEP